MPGSNDGFMGRECPACARFFKVVIGEYDALPDDLVLTCPYRGHSGHSGMSARRTTRTYTWS
jgi:hypothetical protein